MTDNNMFQLHPAGHQETGKAWQVIGKVRLWQERNGADKGEFEHIYCQKSACFCNNWYIEFMARTVVDFY
jgi:hypothetical protein